MKQCNTARIDSFYHGSAVDGEGLRSVVFFSGCNLKCTFCHNPETLYGTGREITLEEAENVIKRYVPYLKKGGVTFSGGEPFLQAEFCADFAEKIHLAGLNVIAETNGTITDERLISLLDGIRLDIKNQNGENGSILIKRYSPFLECCRKYNKDVLLTNVICPKVNDGEKSIFALAELKNYFSFCRGVEFLGFTKLCEEKYFKLKINFPYQNISEATADDIKKARRIFSEYNNLFRSDTK